MIQLYKGRKWHKNKKGEWVWVEGYAVPCESITSSIKKPAFNTKSCDIVDQSAKYTMVEISTLCRFTGFIKEGQKIFENDVIREWIKDEQEPDGGSWSYNVIKMWQGSWCVCGITYAYLNPERLWDRLDDSIEIYGNLWDHPELLKDGTQPSN